MKFFCNVYYFQENNIQTITVIGDVQRYTVYTFQLKSFKPNNVILFQVFLRKSEKWISWGVGGGTGGVEVGVWEEGLRKIF